MKPDTEINVNSTSMTEAEKTAYAKWWAGDQCDSLFMSWAERNPGPAMSEEEISAKKIELFHEQYPPGKTIQVRPMEEDPPSSKND